MPPLRLVLALAILLFAASCADDESAAPAAPALTAAAQATPATGLPRVDGTVDPLGFGGTDPVSVKANPDPPSGQAVLKDVRVGAQPEEGGWDRIVFEFESILPAAEIRYERAVVGCGSGLPISLPGAAVLVVKLQPAVAHDAAGRLTVRALELPGPGGVILQARQTCDFESHVDWAVAVKAQQRFKVTRLANPTRLVIDIKQ